MQHFDADAHRGMTEEQVDRYLSRHAADVERLHAGDLSAIDTLFWYRERPANSMTAQEMHEENPELFRELAARWLSLSDMKMIAELAGRVAETAEEEHQREDPL